LPQPGYDRQNVSTAQRATKQSQTRDRVVDLIEQLGVGSAIPSERQLSVDLGVSRLTVRAALDELVREGLLDRKRGSGTFVREPKIAQELTMTSFSEEMRRRGMRPASRTLSLATTLAGAYLGRCLHVSPSEPIVVAKRLRLADGESMAIETLHVAESRVPALTPKDLEEGSFYELLSSRYGIEIVGGIQTIEPTVTNEEESDALDVPLHSPAFLFERTTRSQTGEIVEFVRSIYRGDRYRLVTELNRRERVGATPMLQPRDGRGAR
jgi:GntR family transcriptional regulator